MSPVTPCADANATPQPHSAQAWAATDALALSLAKGLREGCIVGKQVSDACRWSFSMCAPDLTSAFCWLQYRASLVFLDAHKPLQLLQRVTTPGALCCCGQQSSNVLLRRLEQTAKSTVNASIHMLCSWQRGS